MRLGMLAHKLSFAGDYREAGISRYIEYLLQYVPRLLETNEELHAFARSEDDTNALERRFPSTIRWHWSRVPTGKVPIRIAWEQCISPWITRGQNLDLVHGPVNVIPLASRMPSVVTIHDLAFLAFPEQYPAAQVRYLKSMTAASARRARRVITVSQFTADDVAARLSIPQEKIRAIPNGVSEAFYPRSPERVAAFRLMNDLPEAFILFVGTLQPRKNLIGLLRAFARVPEDVRIPLFVVGAPGWMYSDIFDEVERLGISGDVRFPGYASSELLPLWYSAATAFVYPSYYEGFGLPVLEAMACGTPVITSNVSSLPEVVGDAGITVSPGDVQAIADAIERLLRDTELRESLVSAGQKQSRQFSWAATAEQTVSVYREIALAG
jgi:glycosyltransferase involved in cell wall biosynthesis